MKRSSSDCTMLSVGNIHTFPQALCFLKCITQRPETGWPYIKQLPTNLMPYWSSMDELVESRVVRKGQRVVIPKNLQENLLVKLHEGHLGIKKSRSLARESIYWPNINDHISKMCKHCDTCQKFHPNNRKEPLIAHEIPSCPWHLILNDLETSNKSDLLITNR